MPALEPRDVHFFATPGDFRAWLAANHATAEALWVGFHKKGSGRPSITWPESVDEALCYGWIDGLRQRLDDERYTIRFTPRRPGSLWSAVNTRRAQALSAEGRMQPAGLAAFAARDEAKSRLYSYENRPEGLEPAYEAALRADEAAWAYWQAQPPHYRRGAAHWIMSAKREATRRQRLATLIADSAAGQRIAPFRR